MGWKVFLQRRQLKVCIIIDFSKLETTILPSSIRSECVCLLLLFEGVQKRVSLWVLLLYRNSRSKQVSFLSISKNLMNLLLAFSRKLRCFCRSLLRTHHISKMNIFGYILALTSPRCDNCLSSCFSDLWFYLCRRVVKELFDKFVGFEGWDCNWRRVLIWKSVDSFFVGVLLI